MPYSAFAWCLMSGDVSTSRVGYGNRLSSAPCVMMSYASSSSDVDGAGRRAGVTVRAPPPAPTGAPPGAVLGLGQAAASEGQGHPQHLNHPWVLNLEHLLVSGLRRVSRVEVYWSSQAPAILPLLDLKYRVMERKATR